jgi:hypothetical protein
MKRNLITGLVLFSVLAFTAIVKAQETLIAAETAEELRLRLMEVQAREEALRIRGQQLDEEMKPENIERALAGIGSTKPEELREQRRKQLTIERDSVRTRLKIIEISRIRLEAAVTVTEARAYQESALPMPSPPIERLASESITLADGVIIVPFFSFMIFLGAVIILAFLVQAKLGRANS